MYVWCLSVWYVVQSINFIKKCYCATSVFQLPAERVNSYQQRKNVAPGMLINNGPERFYTWKMKNLCKTVENHPRKTINIFCMNNWNSVFKVCNIGIKEQTIEDIPLVKLCLLVTFFQLQFLFTDLSSAEDTNLYWTHRGFFF